MLRRLIKIIMKLNNCSFFRVVRQTLSMLFPFALLGSFSQMIYRTFLSQDGLFYNVAYLGVWVPDWIMTILQSAFIGVSKITFNLFGILVAYAAAKYTARIYHRDSQLAGVTGIVAILIIAFRYDHVSGDCLQLATSRHTKFINCTNCWLCDWPNIPLAGDRA